MFTNAKIIGPTSAAVYMSQTVARGHAEYVMTRSALSSIWENARLWMQGVYRESTAALEYGSMLDCLTLTPAEFPNRYAVAPEFYESDGMECPKCKSVTDSKSCRACKCDRVSVKVQKPWTLQSDTCKAIVAEYEARGLKIVERDDFNRACAARDCLMNDEYIAALLADSEFQIMATADYPAKTGMVIPVKILIDICPKTIPCLSDMKVNRDISHDAWLRAVADFEYQNQAAMYLDVYNTATGQSRAEFRHVLSESKTGAVGRRWLSAEFIELGRNGTHTTRGFKPGYVDQLEYYAECLAAKQWPGYDDARPGDVERAPVPGWTKVEPAGWMI